MFAQYYKSHPLTSCLILSILVHVLFMYGMRVFETYHFGTPVDAFQTVLVDLADPPNGHPAAAAQKSNDNDEPPEAPEDEAVMNDTSVAAHEPSPPVTASESREPAPVPGETVPSHEEEQASKSRDSEAVTAGSVAESPGPVAASPVMPPPQGSLFLGSKYEKLTYQIRMLGLPVGSAELASANDDGEISITLKVRSNTAISSIYPVDDVVETRHISGRFILTKIRQREGSFRGDEGFSINPERKRVFWFDNIKGRSQNMTIPTEEAVDTLSGIYYLRNRQLEVGKTEILHIFDSETYADVPVEVLRREEIRLPNLTKVNTLVIRPLQQTAGIFRRTGDLLIWMTDDEKRVPVKIVTSIPLGKVTAELVSAESLPHDQNPASSSPGAATAVMRPGEMHQQN